MKQKLLDLLSIYNHPMLECDGMTRVCNYVLTNNNIKHDVYYGTLSSEFEIINTHYWIECEGYVIDFKAKMWFGESVVVPHGVFHKDEYPSFKYEGHPIKMNTSKIIFELLIKPPLTLSEILYG